MPTPRKRCSGRALCRRRDRSRVLSILTVQGRPRAALAARRAETVSHGNDDERGVSYRRGDRSAAACEPADVTHPFGIPVSMVTMKNDKPTRLEEIDRPEPTQNPVMGWGSDAIASLLAKLDFKYVALVPGASYRGLHDSLVNYLDNSNPQMLVCLHESMPSPLHRATPRSLTGRCWHAFTATSG